MFNKFGYAMWEITQLAIILIGALVLSKDEGNLLFWAFVGSVYFVCSFAKAKVLEG